jgi:anthranilate phosphoribosyltransferase
MVHAAGPRKSLGFPTIFNLLGPLTNPAGATRQLLGVYDARFLPLIAEALARLGSEHAMVAHGNDGLDELTTTTTSRLATVNDGATDETTIDPRSLGLSPATFDDLRVVDSPDESAALIEAILAGKAGPPADIALLNAAAAVVVGGLADDLAGGLERARAAVAGGGAADALHRLRKASNA